MTMFFMGKLVIPNLQPFVWDSRLAEADMLLHGGSPWELMQPFLGIPAVTSAISLIYLFWFMLMFGAWVFWAMTDHPQRMRFLISYMLCWILLGTLLATLLSSAGPMFYAEITGDNGLFREQMAYLRAVDQNSPLISLRIRDRLWHAYATGEISAGSGISAMPSLHVAIVTLYAISGWYVSRRVGVAMTLYAVVIFIGSIHLGWHYAVDGYVSIVLVAAIWYLVGKVLDRRHSQDVNPDVAQAVGRQPLVQL